MQNEHTYVDSTGWGSDITIEEDADEDGYVISREPAIITREMNEFDWIMQHRYLDYLEEQFETNFLQINDTMNAT